jgi:hypothetical protein
MNLKPDDRPANRRRRLALLSFFLVGCALAIVAARIQSRLNRDHLDDLVQEETTRIAEAVTERVERVQLGLLGARGLALTLGWQALTREAFIRYSRSRNVDAEFPGVRGIGVIRRVSPEQEAGFIAAAAADGWPGFAVRAIAPNHDDRLVIQYIEPVARNREAVGLDIGSEANRRRAALTAQRTGKATLTGPITLVQATGQPRAGFLILLPVYREGRQVPDPAAIGDQALGWTYAPLVIHEVLQGLQIDRQAWRLRIADVDGGVATPFYASTEAAAIETGHLWQVDTPVAGRTWRVQLAALPAFVASQRMTSPETVGLAGVLLAALLTGALQALLRVRRHARELQIERERRAAALQTSRDAVVMVDPQGTVFDWNQGAQALFGYAPREIIGKSAFDLLVPADRVAETRETAARAARGDMVPAYDTQRLHRDGQAIDVSVLAVPLQGPDGGHAGIALSMRDIRQAKQAQRQIEQLNASLERQVDSRTAALNVALTSLQSTFDAVPALVAYWDKSSVLVRANLAWQRQFAATLAARPGDSEHAQLSALCPTFAAATTSVLEGRRNNFECVLDRPDGRQTWNAFVECLPDIHAGEVIGYYTVLQDVTQQTRDKAQLAAALRESEAFLRTVHTHALVSITDRTGAILDANDNFCRISQYSREELIGRSHRLVSSGLHPREFWVQMWATIASGQPWRGEIRNRGKDGSLYWVDSMIAPILGSDGRVDRFVSIRTDITARKRLQQEVETARELAEQRERFLREVTDKVPLRIAYADASLRYRFVNQRHCERFGLPREQIIGRTRDELTGLPTEGPLQQHLSAVLGGEVQHFETTEDAGGRQRVLETRLIPDLDADGKVQGFYSVSNDITERTRGEETLRRTMTLLNSVLDASSEVAIIATDI